MLMENEQRCCSEPDAEEEILPRRCTHTSGEESGDGHCADRSPGVGLGHAGSLHSVLSPRMLCWL